MQSYYNNNKAKSITSHDITKDKYPKYWLQIFVDIRPIAMNLPPAEYPGSQLGTKGKQQTQTGTDAGQKF
ncbi:MAG: hypothetical protein EZS28_009982 [Streblomastix strix]|uniref:Uncharacterized protein n=1 Tax=Streblomastix strix TaxID=222440 RepID=A0A5J4WIZ1_9EUKA|nr:MAG: hypothetical protein EZS28_009982 [Streblomastix strix]